VARPRKGISGVKAPERRKQVTRSAAPPEPINEKHFQWSVSDIDHEYEGEWGDWDLKPKETADLLSLLEETSKLTWQQVKDLKAAGSRRRGPRQLHHSQSVDSICVEARRRLEQLQLEVEEVFRLRHGNKIRVWGHLQGPTFRIVWYDRKHKICPGEG